MPLCNMCRTLRRNSKTLTDCPISPCPYQQLVSDNVMTCLHLYFISQIIDLDAIDDVIRSIPAARIPSMMTSLIHDFNECLKIPSLDVDSSENELRRRFDLIRKQETGSAAAKRKREKMKRKIKTEPQSSRMSLSLCKMCTALRGNHTTLEDCPVKPCPYQRLVSDNVVTLLQLKFLGQTVQPGFIDSVLRKKPAAERPLTMSCFIYEFNARLINTKHGCIADLLPLDEKLKETTDLLEAKKKQLAELEETLRERRSEVDNSYAELGKIASEFRKVVEKEERYLGRKLF